MNKIPPNIRNMSKRPEGELNMDMINALTNAEIDYISEKYERGNVSGLGIAMLVGICSWIGVFISWWV